MRREKAGCVTWRSWAERLKLRVSARLTKSSSHLVSMAGDYGEGVPRRFAGFVPVRLIGRPIGRPIGVRPVCAARRWPPLGRSALRADCPAVLAKPACTVELAPLL